LDYLYVKMPHKNEWKKYYVRYQNSQLHFYKSVKRHDFKCCYIIYKVLVRRTRVYIGSGDENGEVEKPRKIDTLLISHRFDDECLYITIPEIFEGHSQALGAGNSTAAQKMFHKEFVLMLDEIAKLLTQNASIAPDNKKLVPAGTSQQSFEID
jgi:hypothetical protein